MAHAPILPILLLVVATRCKSDSHNGYHKANGASQFGNLLKPPPPPPLSNLIPVPFHGGAGRLQRQNIDVGYHYQPPPPPPPPPVPPSADFKFPAPFYKQYNFNFVPPPQPFSTTPSPSLFQKVSGWLFPSQQTGYDAGTNSIAPVKKDCNPCNLVPWIPVIRYNLGAKNVFQNSNPTYGPPSPTAYLDAHKAVDFKPQPFQSSQQNFPQLSPGIPHAVYGPPASSHFSNSISIPSSTYGPPVSTYGPPSPTHTVSFQAPNSLSSPYYSSSTSYLAPSTSYSAPSSSYSAPSSSYSAPSSSYSAPSSSYSVPSTSIRHPSSPYSISSSSQGISSTSYSISSSTYATPLPSYGSPVTTTYASVTPLYEPDILNNQLPRQNDVDIFKHPSEELQLPKVTPPTTFKNSYGEPISNSYISDIPYPVSATAAESMKIKTEILPNSTNLVTPNVSLANPAPFTLNRGRNIHTLQPVALPNLSVSPLPPIFNARLFRPTQPNYSTNLVQGINSMQQNSNNVKIEQSVPVVDFTHSVDYPASFVQTPIIDIESTKTYNQTKAYRNIPNAFILNDLRDISYQASEDHVAATKTLPDSSFESTGADFGNELYDAGSPMGFKQASIPNNHKNKFADLRGVRDEDVDKYRTESNLQNIDSPILYLKPSAPHKEYGNFVLAISTPTNDKDYEIYDEIPTTVAPQLSTPSSAWDDSRNDYNEGGQPPTAAQESIDRPKIVQIIVPYTSGHNQQDWEYTQEEEYQARKIPSNTENTIVNTVTHSYNTPSTTTEDPNQVMTDNYDSERLNTAAILNDLYDVKEPPFDIIKLQHTIDDWTEQEYSEHYKTPQRTRGFGKYAKQIPDDYFTTTMPTNYVTATNNYNYDYEDHIGSSSINHHVTDGKGDASKKPRKEYNIMSRDKTRHSSSKNEEEQEVQRLHIYTAASTFRSTTTTPAPWGKILTSISPLTKEKVYVVTSKPWRDARNVTNDWYEVQPFESKRATIENDVSGSDSLPFKSPRFVNRPSLGFTSSGENDSVKSDSSFGFSQSWYQSINDLENKAATSNLSWPEGSSEKHTTNLDEGSADTTTADLHSNPET